MSERIVCFDIEILNNDPTSICSIGIVEMVDFKIVSTYYSLIRPRYLKHDPVRYGIHHIKADSLRHQKPFRVIWKEIKHYFVNSTVVAHDINVDMMHLRETLKREGIKYPQLKMSCTNVLSHLLHPELTKYNLSELTKYYNVDFQAHHALEDAKACALILKNMVEDEGYETLKQLHMDYHLAFGEMKHNYYRNIISAETISNITILPKQKKNDLYHSTVCFTGKTAVSRDVLIQKTKEVSALSAHSVSSTTNYLVIGSVGYQKVRYGKKNKKVLKALELINQGQDLKILHEDEYINMLNKKKI
jgi:DNA polymerase-3 subunit epsilon